MKDTVFLVVSRYGVLRMTKKLPALGRGEIPVKLQVQVDDTAFREPVLERTVHVQDWREGMDFPDPEMRDGIITKAEAKLIVAQRLQALQALLEERGYTVSPPPAEEDG